MEVSPYPSEDRTWNEKNESLSRGVTTLTEEAMKTVRIEDLNSDITANRYPTSHADNHKDRGNMKLNKKFTNQYPESALVTIVSRKYFLIINLSTKMEYQLLLLL
jgi:phage tail sheath gpL-like